MIFLFFITILFAQEKINIITNDGLIINGILNYKPNQNIVICLHGLGSQKEEWNPFIKKLEKNNIAYFIYDLRGHSKSNITTRGTKIDYRRFYDIYGNPLIKEWQKNIDDLKFVIQYFKKKYNISQEKIILAGASLGANIVSNLNNKKILLSPGLNYHGIQLKPFVNSQKILWIVSKQDYYSFNTMLALKKDIEKNPFLKVIITQKGHGVEMLTPELLDKIIKWIKK